MLSRVNSALEPQFTQLDSIACRGLDTIEAYQENVISTWNTYFTAENLRSLQFCLDWLNYATSHIDRQIHLLRHTMSQMLHTSESQALIPLLALVQNVKREVVETVRKVVDVISKYAGSGLPLHAKNLIRGFILSLPGRWATVSSSIETSSNGSHTEATRVLTLAEESNRVLKNTKDVVDKSVRMAEQFVGKDQEPQSQGPSNTFK